MVKNINWCVIVSFCGSGWDAGLRPNPDVLDCDHDGFKRIIEFIIKRMNAGAMWVSEKPMTYRRFMPKANLGMQSEKSGSRLIVTYYRYFPTPPKASMKNATSGERSGQLTSVGFFTGIWILLTGQINFRRWHGIGKIKGGTLIGHKSTHQFWRYLKSLGDWLWSIAEVFALWYWGYFNVKRPIPRHYCKRMCAAENCDFHWDITQRVTLMKSYVEMQNTKRLIEIREGCVFRESINIYDINGRCKDQV